MSKKNLSYLVIIALLFILNLILAGDGGKVLIGEPITAKSVLSLSDLSAFPESYVNKVVRIEGEIASIDQDSRCSFILKDNKGNEICVQCSGCGYPLSGEDIGRQCIVQGEIVSLNLRYPGNQPKVGAFGFKSTGKDSQVLLSFDNRGYTYYLDSFGIILE
jgi:hypothetical protein